jgi:hypothetical protein
MTYALKFLNQNGLSPNQRFDWPKPKGGKPGRWVKAEGDLQVCRNGIHAVRLDVGALDWLNAQAWVIEMAGKVRYDETERKYVARKGRLVRRVDGWDEKAQRLFAAECAEHVLPIFEKRYPDDKRPHEAIEAARRFARYPTEKNRERMDAAGDAASAAARDAAGPAARAAAGDAAWDAAWEAAGPAAGLAARDAAWDAASAAASAAAGPAARPAAWAAERAWQVERLRGYIDAQEVG